MPLKIALESLLFDLDLQLSKEDRQNLYIAEDYFGWHNQPESEALKLVLPIFEKYKPIYESAVAKFGVNKQQQSDSQCYAPFVLSLALKH